MLQKNPRHFPNINVFFQKDTQFQSRLIKTHEKNCLDIINSSVNDIVYQI